MRIGPTTPIHLARAYGLAPAPAPAPRPPVSPQLSGLIAGEVPGSAARAVHVAPAASAAEGPLPLYRHPADANAAVTGVQVGRSLDVRG